MAIASLLNRFIGRKGEIAYEYWCCLCDKDSCDKCRSLEGTAWIPGMVEMVVPPLPSCQSPKGGCRCIVVGVGRGEVGAAEIAEFIRKAGGKVTGKQLDRFFETKWALVFARAEKESLALEKTSVARELEGEQPEEAVARYRESIEIRKELAKESPEPWSWRDFPYIYNRLTLVLERLGRYGEALEEIERYKTLAKSFGDWQYDKAEMGAIRRREMRLKKIQQVTSYPQ